MIRRHRWFISSRQVFSLFFTLSNFSVLHRSSYTVVDNWNIIIIVPLANCTGIQAHCNAKRPLIAIIDDFTSSSRKCKNIFIRKYQTIYYIIIILHYYAHCSTYSRARGSKIDLKIILCQIISKKLMNAHAIL